MFPCDLGEASPIQIASKNDSTGHMLDNESTESLLRIPSHSSDLACAMLELDGPIFARSESAPVCNDNTCDTARPCLHVLRRHVSVIQRSSSEDVPFRRGTRSCPDRPVGVVERKPARIMSKREHNFLVGLQLHRESFCIKACKVSRDQDYGLTCSTGFGQLPSAELWEALLQ